MRTEYRKLVRDKIPEIIRERGGVPETHVADAEEYQRALFAKAVEEAQEVAALNGCDPVRLADEMADILEVLRAIAQTCDLPWTQVEHAALRKVRERGSFTKRIILDSVEEPDQAATA